MEALDTNGQVADRLTIGIPQQANTLGLEQTGIWTVDNYVVYSGWTYRFTVADMLKTDLNPDDNVKTVDLFG